MGATQTYAVNNSLVRVFNDDNFAPVLRSASTSSPTFKSLSPRQEWQMLLMFQSVYCDDLFSNTDVMEEISHADIIVGEFIYLCSTLIADKFSLPLVLISAATLDIPSAFAFGLPAPPSYIPQYGVSLSDKLTFTERAWSLLQWIILYGSYIYDMCPPYEKIKAKYAITPSKSIQETLGRVDLIIAQMNFLIEHSRPLYPSKYQRSLEWAFFTFLKFLYHGHYKSGDYLLFVSLAPTRLYDEPSDELRDKLRQRLRRKGGNDRSLM